MALDDISDLAYSEYAVRKAEKPKWVARHTQGISVSMSHAAAV